MTKPNKLKAQFGDNLGVTELRRFQRRVTAMNQLIEIANKASISQDSLRGWLNSPTGYLHGCRPIDWLDDDPEAVLWAAEQAFNVEW